MLIIFIHNFQEFRTMFPQLTGVLTLAFFIHNCIITLMKNNRHQENNVSYFLLYRGPSVFLVEQ